MQDLGSIQKAVKYVLDRYPMGHEFGSLELRREVARLYPKYKCTFADTITRRLREVRKGEGYGIFCINHPKSLYKKIELQKKSRAA